MANHEVFSMEDLDKFHTRDKLLEFLKEKAYLLDKVLDTLRYEEELIRLQGELVKLQN